MSAQPHSIRLRVRARMASTGEPYTVALRAVQAELGASPARGPVAARGRVRPEAQAEPHPTSRAGLTPSFCDGREPDVQLTVHAHESPDCRAAKHQACSGDAWCTTQDRGVPCSCPCHARAAVA